MTEVVIFGAGGLGGLIDDTLRQTGRYRVVAFLDSDPRKHGRRLYGVPVRGGIEQIERLRWEGATDAIVAIGENATRVRVAEQLRARGLRLASAVHPLASIAPSARIGEHVFIGPRATVCVHARIGEHTLIAAGAIVEHDNRIGRGVFVHAAVRLAGGVHVEDLATLGIGACVIPGRRIGRRAHVQPGAVVIRDVRPGAHVGGVPAGLPGPGKPLLRSAQAESHRPRPQLATP